MFNGTPAPDDINGTPSFNLTEFLYNHRPAIIDPMLTSTIGYMRDAMGVKKVVATGYCFGGRYTFRELAEGKGADAGFAAHPTLLEDGEIEAITGPVSVAAAGEYSTFSGLTSLMLMSCAEVDDMMPPERRHEIAALLQETNQAYSVSLYGGTEHGFGVRANVSDPQQKFGKEEAFFQAVRWFDTWA